jgi:hypothetical protein
MAVAASDGERERLAMPDPDGMVLSGVLAATRQRAR